MRKSTILIERVHMGIRLFSAVIMSHPAGNPNNTRFTKMFRPLIEKKKRNQTTQGKYRSEFRRTKCEFSFQTKKQ